MVKTSVLLIAIRFVAIMIVGLEARSTVLQANPLPLETNNQGLYRNRENGTINGELNLEKATTNTIDGANNERKNEQSFVDAVSGAVLPDRKPMDNSNSKTIAPVTVEAVLNGEMSNEPVTVEAMLESSNLWALKNVREQGIAYKSARIESNPVEGGSATKTIREEAVAQKSVRVESVSSTDSDSSATALKGIREEAVAVKSPRIQQTKSPNDTEIVSASKNIREQGMARKSSLVMNENGMGQKSIRTESPKPNNGDDAETDEIILRALKGERVQSLPLKSTQTADKVQASKGIREKGTAQKSSRVETNHTEDNVWGLKGIREQGIASKSSRTELGSQSENIWALKGVREQGTASKTARTEPLNETDDDDEHGFNLPPYGPFYCTAWCVASCVDKKFGSLEQCQDSCSTFNENVQCADDDVDCWRTCNGLTGRASSVQLKAPKIFYSGYVQVPTYDPLSISIDWDMITEDLTYIVEFIPTPEAAAVGATSLQAIVDHPWYVFKKADICHEYYARVAALNSDGVGKMSKAVLIKAAPLQVSDDLTFTVMDTFFSEKREFAFVRVSYTRFSGFGPNDYAINGRVSATQCKNPVNELFINADVTNPDSDVYYPLVHIEKSDTEYEMVIVLPEKIYSADCLYSFKASSFVTRCGVSTEDGLAKGGTSIQFQIDVSATESKNVPSIMQQGQVGDVSLPICQMTGFDAKMLNNNNGKMNVVVSWDAIMDNIHKTYIVHHWSNERSLLVPQTSIPKPENERQMVLTVTNTADNKILYYLPEALNSNDLHEFQICAVSANSDDVIESNTVDWQNVPSIKIDLLSLTRTDSLNSLSSLTSIDGKNVTWLFLIALLAAVCFLLVASILVGKNVKCGRTKKNGFTKIYSLPDNSSVESKTKLAVLPDSTSFSNPIV